MTHESIEISTNTSLHKTPIAIIGMGAIFPQSENLQEYWDNIIKEVDCITDVPSSRWNIDDYYDPDPKAPDKTYCKRGGFIPDIDFNPMEFGLPPNILEVTDVSQLLSLVVAKEAMKDAGYGESSNFNGEKTGVILGVGGGQKLISPLTARLQYPIWERVLESSGVAKEDREQIIEKMKLAYIRWEENSFPGMLGNVIAGRVANRLDLGGTNCVVDAACAASLAAVKMAVSELVEHRADTMITGGVDTDNSIFMYMSFSKTPAFSRQQEIKPFDADSDGMMIGEGVGMVVLKRLADAERDNDRIYAVIKGIGSSSDGRYKSIYAPRSSGQAVAVRRAYQDAGFPPETVGLIEAHGTGTAAGDRAEFAGLNEVFNQNNQKKQHIALGSVKSQIGHTKAAAGAASLIKTALALHHKVLPPTLNVEQPNPKMDIENSLFYLNTHSRPWIRAQDAPPRRAGVSAFGFGGTNFHFVLEEYAQEHSPRQTYRLHMVPQTILLAATSPAGLLEQCQKQLALLQQEDGAQQFAVLAQVSKTLNIPASAARVGFVAQSAAEAVELLQLATTLLQKNQQVESWEHPKGIYYRQSGLATEGKVVALFPGQGSQYLEMGKELALNFPSLRQAYSNADTLFAAEQQTPLSNVVYPTPQFDPAEKIAQSKVLESTEYAQPAIGAFSFGLYKLLQQAGFSPDFVAGHSFGELTALWAAGVINDEDYFFLIKARGKAMAPPANPNFDAGTMLAVKGDAEQLQQEIRHLPDVTIANLNSSRQIILAGPKAAMKNAQQYLEEKGYFVTPLPVSAAFHTSLVGHAQQPFAQDIERTTFNAPAIPVYSNTTGLPHPNQPRAIQLALEEHILKPVLFQQEIENIYAAGGTIFVEIGPKSVLTNLVKNILGVKPHLAVAVNPSHQKDSDRQLREAYIQLRVAGLALQAIDPYQIDTAIEVEKKALMTVQISGNNYVSAPTRAAYNDALNNGHKIAASTSVSVPAPVAVATAMAVPVMAQTVKTNGSVMAQNSNGNTPPVAISTATKVMTINETSTPKQTPVMVGITTVQNNTNGKSNHSVGGPLPVLPKTSLPVTNGNGKVASHQNGRHAEASPSVPSFTDKRSVDSLERNIALLHDHQAETLRVHEAYLKNQEAYSTSIFQLMKQRYSAQPEVTARLNDAQEQSQPIAAPAPAKPVGVQVIAPDAVLNNGFNSKHTSPVVDTPPSPPIELPTPVVAPAIAPAPVAPAPAAAPSVEVNELAEAMLAIVSEKTGYPVEMLELGMDMEADLGIDSIKRVEILGAMQEQYPDLPPVNPEALAELRTLGQIVEQMQGSAVVAPVVAPAVEVAPVVAPALAVTPSVEVNELAEAMLAIVSEKTGYPVEMLELGMDMEADLGIDSIKRVEILGAMQEQYPDLPPVNPEALAELRTLGQIVEKMQGESGAVVAVAAPIPAPVVEVAPAATPAPAVEVNELAEAMLAIVSEKTGYPVEMLELGMDMEADLGIDSIKRVEILGAMQEQYPDLPPVNPEALAELRTLGQIVEQMQGNAVVTPAAAPVVETAPVVALASAATSGPVVEVNELAEAMLAIVSEKTGYPVEMLELEMDMESDLGVDSIKRVEILGAMQEQYPDLPPVSPEDLAELFTLGQIVEKMQRSAAVAAPIVEAAPVVAPAATQAPVNELAEAMLAIVSEKTGYPVEMLELEMDMESDLGVDSIKRVEILGAMQEQYPDLPPVSPEELAELFTLGQIVEKMQRSAGKTVVAPVIEAAPVVVAPAATPSVEVNELAEAMLAIVSEKTGYPVEMLELEMDMESDLGVDSIKRVEILGAMQEQYPDLPPVSPEDLAELFTLGQIVERMQRSAGAVVAAPVTEAAPAVAPAATPLVAVDELAGAMLAIVSEKTGYPVEMLELGMDMEADLGIDSIKRVEILGAMQEQYPDLPPVNPEQLAEIRTLGGIVDALGKFEPAAGEVGLVETNIVMPVDLPEHSITRNVVKLQTLAAPDFLETALPDNYVCLLTDDGTQAAAHLAHLLMERGWKVAVLSFPETVVARQSSLPQGVSRSMLENMSEAHLQQQLAAISANVGPIGAFIHLNPVTDPGADAAKAVVKQVFFIAKHLKTSLNEAAQHGRASFVTVGRLDGEFGFSGAVDFNPVDGGLFGLTKTMNLEWPQVFCRAIDLHPGFTPEQAAQCVLAELYDPNRLIAEVGYGNSGRTTLIAEETAIPSEASGSQISPASVFVVSGGAKGITAQCVIRLAQQHRCKFVLLGRSSIADVDTSWLGEYVDEASLKRLIMEHLLAQGDKPTPAKVQQLARAISSRQEIEQTLQAVEQAGGQAEYLSLDVTDGPALQRELAAVTDRLGQITGIIHGAGVLSDKLIEKKTEQDFEAVYATKVQGLQALLNSVPPQQLEHLVLFSSAAGFYGNVGQADYALANEILNKTAHLVKRQHPACHVVSINWGPWDAGMVTPALKQLFAERNIEVIPVEVGTWILSNELSSANQDVVQTVVGGPLFFPQNDQDSGLRSYHVHRMLSLEANPFLNDHVIGGHPVLPTVNAIAWMGNVCEQLYPGYTMFSCDNYQVLKGIVFDEETGITKQVVLDLEETDKSDGKVDFKVVVWSKTGDGKLRYHYRAGITLLQNLPDAPIYDNFDSSESQPITHDELYGNGTLFHGPSFRGVEQVLNVSPKKLTMRCVLPPISDVEQGQFRVQSFNPYIADGQFQSMVIWARYFHDAGSLPLKTRRGEQYRPIPFGETSYVSMDVVSSTESKLVANIITHDAEGRVYAQVFDAEVTISKQLNSLFVPVAQQ